MGAYLEIVDKRLELTYQGFSPEFLKKIKKMSTTFKATPYPRWYMKLDIQTCKEVRALFGEELTLGPEVKKWAKQKLRKHDNLAKIALSDSAELKILPTVLPELYKKIHVGPRGKNMSKKEFAAALKEPPSYQTADVAFMAQAEHPINLLQPGLGKTIETIACIYEAEMEQGPKLIVAPLTSLESVWAAELAAHQGQPILYFGDNKPERRRIMAQAMKWKDEGVDFWLCVNPQSFCLQRSWVYCEDHLEAKSKGEKIRLSELRACWDCVEVLQSEYPEILSTYWSVMVVDEFHKMGLGNAETLTYQTLEQTKADKKIILSGTPIGGVPIKLFFILTFLYPKDFTSKWRFAEQWLEVGEKEYERRGKVEKSKTIGDVRDEKADAFYEMLSAYVVRRTKDECAPWLPDKLYVELWAKMSGKQKAQYEEFAREAEIRIDEEQLNATSILAEYTRLKQFANASMTILGRDDNGRPILRPTTDSCKLPHILEILEERGIAAHGKSEGDQQVVIFSQFTQIADMICDELQRLGYSADRITGAVKTARRNELIKEFQAGTLRVLVMNVKAGGVSITLDNADTVIFTDETWNPDDQEQAEDRTHRVSRVHQVTVYVIRTRGTIEEYIQVRVLDKARINNEILDLRRKGLRATAKVH